MDRGQDSTAWGSLRRRKLSIMLTPPSVMEDTGRAALDRFLDRLLGSPTVPK
jgi:hypothetical protein